MVGRFSNALPRALGPLLSSGGDDGVLTSTDAKVQMQSLRAPCRPFPAAVQVSGWFLFFRPQRVH